MTREEIFEKIDNYTTDQLFEFVESGIITSTELFDATEHTPLSKKVRVGLQDKLAHYEKDFWGQISNQNTIDAYQDYLQRFPNGQYSQNAKNAIADITNQEQQAKITKAFNDLKNSDDWNNCNALDTFCLTYPRYFTEEISNRKQQIQNENLQPDVQLDMLRRDIAAIDDNRGLSNSEKHTQIIDRIRQVDVAVFVDLLQQDSNIINSEILDKLLRDPNYQDRFNTLDKQVIHYHCNNTTKRNGFKLGRDFDSINYIAPEIYFWGVPRSGKTCALAGILSAMQQGTDYNKAVDADTTCQANFYLSSLMGHFRQTHPVTILPQRTPENAIYQMAFSVLDKQDKYHDMVCLDLAGEIIIDRFLLDTGDLDSNIERKNQVTALLNQVDSILTSRASANRKIHFFVLEYGAQDKQWANTNLTQDQILTYTVNHFGPQGLNIFPKGTDAIYIIVTKADKCHKTGKELQLEIGQWILKYYKTFYNSLKNICVQYNINGGEVEIIPFTLGEVHFQDYCKYDIYPSSQVVKTLLERTDSYKSNQSNIFKKNS